MAGLTVCKRGDNIVGYLVDCPGCGHNHYFRTVPSPKSKGWRFNKDLAFPSFTPSLIARWREHDKDGNPTGKVDICHFWLVNGVFKFCEDSTHKFAGKELPME